MSASKNFFIVGFCLVVVLASACRASRHVGQSAGTSTFSDTVITKIVMLDSAAAFPLALGQKIEIKELGLRVQRLSDNEVVVSSPVRETVRTIPVAVRKTVARRTVRKEKVKVNYSDRRVDKNVDKSVRKNVEKTRPGFSFVGNLWWLILLLIGYAVYRVVKGLPRWPL